VSDNAVVLRDTFGLVCSDLISKGSAREVYTFGFDKNLIVKVETGAQSFQNIIEWETWSRVKFISLARWFAPCVHISACGTVLVMARTTQPAARQYPAKLPIFLTDTKRSNYGLYKGRFVCHDYGHNLLMEYGMTKKMRRSEWWDE